MDFDLLKEVAGAHSIGISGHVRPDGDCIGSILSMSGYLHNACPDAEITVFCDDNPPTIFAYLLGYDSMCMDPGRFVEPFDVFISLDCSEPGRLSKSQPLFENAHKKICIDHHESGHGFGDVSLVRPYASSTCEILYEIFDKKYMDDRVAEAIYTGIVHDTGVFQYSCMSKRTFEIVGELSEYHFDGPAIIQKTFYQKTYTQNQILGRALLESILFMDGKCIVSVISKKMMDFYNVLPKHLEGIVNQLQFTKGVEVAILMYEMETQKYKVSLRSNGKVNVAKVSVYFGGGGHERAAGVEMRGTQYDVINNLSAQIALQLE